jgi:hypothetical protein
VTTACLVEFESTARCGMAGGGVDGVSRGLGESGARGARVEWMRLGS